MGGAQWRSVRKLQGPWDVDSMRNGETSAGWRQMHGWIRFVAALKFLTF